MSHEELEEHESVKKWKKSLAENSKDQELNEDTWVQYMGRMSEFCKMYNMNPDQLLKEPVESVKSRIVAYFNRKKEDISYNSAITYAHGMIRSFYTHNGISFGKWKRPRKKLTRVTTTDRAFELLKKNKTLETCIS